MGMTDAWVIPLLPAAAFVALTLLGPYLPRRGDWLAIGAMLVALILVFPVIADFTDALAQHG